MITKFPPKNFRENFPYKVSAEITVINMAWIFRWFFGENWIQSENFGQKNFWQKNSQVFFPTENFIIGNSGPGMKFYPESWFLTSYFLQPCLNNAELIFRNFIRNRQRYWKNIKWTWKRPLSQLTRGHSRSSRWKNLIFILNFCY